MASPEPPFDHATDMSDDSDNDPRDSRESRKRNVEHGEGSEDNSKRIKLVDDKCQNDENGDTGRYYRKGGLANSLHGNIYQLKLLALFMKRALDENYEFLLGTEVEAAYKWDDIVLLIKRQGETKIYEIIVLQAKHRLDESKKITLSDLLSDDDNFSLQKYFISNLKMRQHPEFSKNKVKNFIIYTNIDFDYSNLKEMSINTKDISENDPILKVTKSSKTAKRVKLSVSKDHILYEKLRETTDLHVLAKELKQHIGNKSTIKLTSVFEHYMYALSKTVFHIKTETVRKSCKKLSATFRDEFVNGVNLSEDVQNFRNILQSSLKTENSDKFSETLSQTKLSVSKSFAQIIDIHPDPIIEDSKYLANTFADFVIEAQNEQRNVITISRTRNVIDSNINKLAFHILVQDKRENGLVKFAKIFFDESRNLKGNLNKFRTDFKAALKMRAVDFFQLRRHKFNISKFYTCEETSEGDVVFPKTELSKDTVRDTDIEDFLDKLVFAVNQPNELELGEIIAEEMGQSSQFNLLDANLVSNSFLNIMLDWFKEKRPEKNKEGVWLDAQSGKEFMNSLEQKVSVLISSGTSIAYPDKLAKFDVTFRENKISKKIKMFLSKENVSEKILYIIAPEKETLLSTLNVYHSLETLKQQEEYALYQKNDSCIFMRLKTLLGEKIQSYIINSFKSSGCYHLLIVDCKSIASPRNEMTKLCRKLSGILMETNKKIILIAEKDYDIIENFDEDLKPHITTNTDDITFLDLTDNSKSMLLQKQVIFQGRSKKVCLNRLINQSDEKAKDVISVDIIVKLLKNKDIRIGKELKDLSEINEYYVHRKFKPVVFNVASIQKYLEESSPNTDLFVVTGADCGLQHMNIYASDNIQSAEEKFKDLLFEHDNLCNIHWLESDSKNLIWFKSYGSILNLMPYRTQNDHVANSTICPYLIGESKLIDESSNCDKIIIISGKAGMGKSTVLTYLSMKLINDPNLWVVRINLNDYTKIFEEIIEKIKNGSFSSFGQSAETIIHFLVNGLMVLQENCKFEKELFMNNFKNHQKIAFLFDGFDEISPVYAGIVIDLLQSLRKFRVKNIFVTTRLNFRHELEKAFEAYSYQLAPFSKDEPVEFLAKFWAKKLNLNKEYLGKLKTYAEAVITQICECIYDEEKEFVSTPLHLMMIAEVFKENNIELTPNWQGCKEFIVSDLNSPELPKRFTLVKLYEHFVHRKYFDFFLRDKGIKNLSKIGARIKDKESIEEYNRFKKRYGLLAMQLFFNEKELNKLLSSSEIKIMKAQIEDFNNAGHLKGIVDQVIEGKPQFVHRTFAEYLASIVIAKKILASPSDTLQSINDSMLNMSPIFMQSIIEHLAGKHETLTLALQKPLLHYIVTDSCSNFLKLLLHCKYSDWQRKLDACGKSPLHYAVENGLIDIIEKLLKYADDIHTDNILEHGSFKYPQYENSVLVKFINVEDNDGKTALYYAVQKKGFDIAFELLLKGACIALLTDENVNELICHMYSMGYDFVNKKYILCSNGERQLLKYHPIQEKLVLTAPGFFNNVIERDHQSEILSYFFEHGRVKVIDTLLATLDDVNIRKEILVRRDRYGKNSLENVLCSDVLSDESRLEITQYLFEHSDGFSIFSNETTPIKQVIENAAMNGCVKTLNYLIDLEEQTDFYHIIKTACQFGEIKTVKYLYETHKDLIIDSNGNTGLHAACSIQSLPLSLIPNYLLPKYLFVRRTMSQSCRLDIIKYLIDNGDINAKNKDDQTPLDFAKSQATQNVIEYLISKGATPNCEAKCGITALGIACDKDNGAKSLGISEKPQKQSKSVESFGYPRLHSAIISKEFEWAIKFIRQGADVNEENSNGDAPLHLCIKEYCEDVQDVVKMLLQYGAVFDIKDKSDRTPLDLIPVELNGSTVWWVLETLKKLFSSEILDTDLFNVVYNSDGYPGTEKNPLVFMLNSRNNQGKTLLHVAADTGEYNALDELLIYNEPRHQYCNKETSDLPEFYYETTLIDSTDLDGNTPLHLAAKKGCYEIVFTLLKYGAKFDSINSEGTTPELLATENNHTDIVEVLQAIKQLFVAIGGNDTVEIEKYVKDAKHDKHVKKVLINVVNQSDKSPLHLAVSLNQLEPQVVKLLLDNGADVKTIDDKGNTPLHMAALNDNINYVKLLLDYGAIYDAKNNNNDEPLKLARGKSYDLLKLIDSSYKAINGDKPHKAVANLEKYDKDVIAAIVHSCDNTGVSLLNYAAYLGNFRIVECLFINGAIHDSVHFIGTSSFTPDHKCSAVDLIKTVKLMFNNLNSIYESAKKVNIKVIQNALDGKRKSLIDYAKERGDLKIISFLNDLMADEM